MKHKALTVGYAIASCLPCAAFAGSFTTHFPIEACEFNVNDFEEDEQNRYFILKPGREAHYDNARCVAAGECTDVEELVITVLRQTHDITLSIGGEQKTIKTRVVEERETANGQLKEISRNYYAECDNTQDVYYFGEDVDIYNNGVIVSHDGAWLAGQNGARPGIIFPGGAFLLGAGYYQELAFGVALDRARHTRDNIDMHLPAGDFEKCVKTRETTPLEEGSVSIKHYCPDTGLVTDGDLELVSVSD